MEKIWLESYPPGVPAEIDLSAFRSLNSVLEWACVHYAQLPAFSNQGSTITYAELDALSESFASYLQNVLHLGRGARVAIMMPNLLQYPAVLFGVLRAGCTVVNTNPLYTARELHQQLDDSGAVCIVILENFAHLLQAAMPDTGLRDVIVTRVGDLFHFPKAQIVNFVVEHVRHIVPPWHIDGAVWLSDALTSGSRQSLSDRMLEARDIAFLQYTGGTTGTPKGAILTHGNLVANLLQVSAWVDVTLKEREEVAVIPLPLYHIFALIAMLTFFKLGARTILITNPRDTEGFINEIRHAKFSVMIGVETLFNNLLNSPGSHKIDTGHVKAVIAGGMAVHAAVAKKWLSQFGVPIIEGYGLTECSPIVCANRMDIAEFTGTIGLPVSSTEVSIRDESNQELAPGGLGEICIRGPQVMKGYWNNPAETAHVFTPDGWLRTGDLGVIDERGYVTLVDRRKDMIVVSGFKVFPNEIEQVVMMLGEVLEAAAVPAEDARSGQVVQIVVVTASTTLTAEQVIEHCRKNLTAYKVPRYVVLRSQPLPKSAIGKVLRRIVSEELRSESAGKKSGAVSEYADTP